MPRLIENIHSNFLEGPERGNLSPVPPEAPKVDMGPESLDGLFSELVDTRNDFPKHWGLLVKQLRELSDQSPESINFGPQYRVKDKDNIVTITTIFFDPNENRRDLCLVATDEAGSIVGDLYQKTVFHPKLKRAQSDGIIVTNPKLRGGAMSINLAVWHMLQLEANRRNSEIEWSMHNSNLDSLEALVREYRKTKNEELLDKIEDMRNQQQRWQSMFGYGGKMGVGKDGIKQLLPNNEETPADLRTLEEVKLKRVEKPNGQVYPKIVNYKTNSSLGGKDKGKLFSDLNQLLNTELEPAIQ